MRPRPPRGARARRRPRPGLRLRRDPRLWWLAVIALAALIGSAVSATVNHAERAREAWGPSQPVLVAVRSLRPGDPVGPGDVRRERRPRTAVPEGALVELPPSPIASASIQRGEVLVHARLATGPLSAVAARIPPGQRAVAIPIASEASPPLEPGDRVDVVVALPHDAGWDGPSGFVVAAAALVVAVDEAAVTVAVDRDAAPRVAVALGSGAVTLALLGADGAAAQRAT